MVESPCHTCHGKRYRPEALAVKLGGLNIAEPRISPSTKSRTFLNHLTLNAKQQAVASGYSGELNARLDFLINVGLLLSDAVPFSGDAFGRRGPAHPPGNPDRQRADGVLYIPGRAQHWPAPAGQHHAS